LYTLTTAVMKTASVNMMGDVVSCLFSPLYVFVRWRTFLPLPSGPFSP